MIRWLRTHPLKNKRVIVRVDFNVPMKGKKILDNFRIRASIPTIRLLLKSKNTVVLITHLGQPQRPHDPAFSVRPVAKHLAKLLKHPISVISDPKNTRERARITTAKLGSVFLLENIRFWPEEEKNSPAFAKMLAGFGDAFVEDAFGVIHRAHASVARLPHLLPAYGGLLLESELKNLDPLVQHPRRPFVVLMGGAKIKTKMPFIRSFLQKGDRVLIGGALANTILKVRGIPIGQSRFEPDMLREAKRIASHPQLFLPKDARVATGKGRTTAVRKIRAIEHNDAILDIGPETERAFAQEIRQANTVLWNGPLGLIEKKQFRHGTFAIAQSLKKSRAYIVVGGGDLVPMLERAKVIKYIDHIATGGGSTLAYITGFPLPGLEAIQ